MLTCVAVCSHIRMCIIGEPPRRGHPLHLRLFQVETENCTHEAAHFCQMECWVQCLSRSVSLQCVCWVNSTCLPACWLATSMLTAIISQQVHATVSGELCLCTKLLQYRLFRLADQSALCNVSHFGLVAFHHYACNCQSLCTCAAVMNVSVCHACMPLLINVFVACLQCNNSLCALHGVSVYTAPKQCQLAFVYAVVQSDTALYVAGRSPLKNTTDLVLLCKLLRCSSFVHGCPIVAAKACLYPCTWCDKL